GDDAQGRLWLSEHRVRRSETEVAGQGEFATAAERGAVDQRDRRPAMRREPLERPGVDGQERRIRVPLAQFGDVGPGGEHARRGGVDDQDAGAAAGLAQHPVQFVDHGLVERVVLGRTVQAHPPQVALTAYPDHRVRAGAGTRSLEWLGNNCSSGSIRTAALLTAVAASPNPTEISRTLPG